MESDEVPDILKIPKPLQEKYFSVVEEEISKLLKRFSSMDMLLRHLRERLEHGISLVEPRQKWRDYLIAVVDGSDSPAIDQRIGVLYGLYAAAYKLFRGFEPVEDGERYLGDRVSDQTQGQRDILAKILDLATTYIERALAHKLLTSTDPKVDLLLIDGSFLGYRAGCSMVKEEALEWREPITNKYFDKVYDLIEAINSLTVQIAESGRAVGIIKRVPTAAISGYMYYKYGRDQAPDLSDRSILTLVMRRGELFSYASYLKGLRYEALSWYKTVVRERGFKGKTPDEVLREAERRFTVQLVADLTDYSRVSRRNNFEKYADKPIVKLAGQLRRYFLRTREDLPPICIEVPERVPQDLFENVLSYCMETSSPATGLPLSLDLIDDLVSLPRGLGRDFIGEIEAGLLRHGVDKEKLLALFSRFNPQKEEF